MEKKKLVRGVIYDDPVMTEDIREEMAVNIAVMPSFVRKAVESEWLDSKYENCQNEVVVDGVLSCVLGSLESETRNLIISEDSIDNKLRDSLRKIDIGNGLRERVRHHMVQINPEFIDPYKENLEELESPSEDDEMCICLDIKNRDQELHFEFDTIEEAIDFVRTNYSNKFSESEMNNIVESIRRVA